MNSNLCSKCGKPVFFAERRTSLGRNWHPLCLKCVECGKLLSPGQHAEHKGLPYCHRPCYAALYGPRIMGYGSNLHSPANYRRSSDHGTLYTGQTSGSHAKMVFDFSHATEKNGSVHKNSNSQIDNNKESAALSSPRKQKYDTETQELLQKVKDFNKFYEGKKRPSLTTISNPESGDLLIQGPLRIYWGVNKPIQLQQFDDVPSQNSQTSWRHSFVPGQLERPPDGCLSPKQFQEKPDFLLSPSASSRLGVDDSIIQSPPEGVILRKKKNIKKFNTVAYRGDNRPDKWKRASINGHIYNFDTRVFTPVIGSCTTVSIDSTFNTPQVIKTLLEKFKIENKPDQYSLYVVNDADDEERLLQNSDIPLLERINLGPDETSGKKIYLRDKVTTPRKKSLVQVAVPEEVVEEEEEVNKPAPLPEEVQTLINIPEPVLRGILQKYHQDEEIEIKTIKARYLVTKRRLKEELAKLKDLKTKF